MAYVQCASDCESEELCYVHVTLALSDLRAVLNYYFYNILRYAISICRLLYLSYVVIL